MHRRCIDGVICKIVKTFDNFSLEDILQPAHLGWITQSDVFNAILLSYYTDFKVILRGSVSLKGDSCYQSHRLIHSLLVQSKLFIPLELTT